MTSLPGISIVLCCHNSASRIANTLGHIAGQKKVRGLNWEVILIDNASIDQTQVIAKQVWEKSNCDAPFRLATENRLGLNFARETGFELANFDWVLWCDDDNWLMPDYLQKADQIISDHPEIGVLGGWGEPVFEEDPPAWIKHFKFLSTGLQAPASGIVSSGFVYGAGSLFRRSVYFQIRKAGYLPLLTDRVGSLLSSGGDYELCYNFSWCGFYIWFDEVLRFKHFMPKERMTWTYYQRFFDESMTGFEVLEAYRILASQQQFIPFYLFPFFYFRQVGYYGKRIFPAALAGIFFGRGSEKGMVGRMQFKICKNWLWHFFRDLLKIRKQYLIGFEWREKLKRSNGNGLLMGDSKIG